MFFVICLPPPPLQMWMNAPLSSTPAPMCVTTQRGLTCAPVAMGSASWRMVTPAMVRTYIRTWVENYILEASVLCILLCVRFTCTAKTAGHTVCVQVSPSPPTPQTYTSQMAQFESSVLIVVNLYTCMWIYIYFAVYSFICG